MSPYVTHPSSFLQSAYKPSFIIQSMTSLPVFIFLSMKLQSDGNSIVKLFSNEKIGVVKILRVLRVLRPLRAINRAKGLKVRLRRHNRCSLCWSDWTLTRREHSRSSHGFTVPLHHGRQDGWLWILNPKYSCIVLLWSMAVVTVMRCNDMCEVTVVKISCLWFNKCFKMFTKELAIISTTYVLESDDSIRHIKFI